MTRKPLLWRPGLKEIDGCDEDEEEKENTLLQICDLTNRAKLSASTQVRAKT